MYVAHRVSSSMVAKNPAKSISRVDRLYHDKEN